MPVRDRSARTSAPRANHAPFPPRVLLRSRSVRTRVRSSLSAPVHSLRERPVAGGSLRGAPVLAPLSRTAVSNGHLSSTTSHACIPGCVPEQGDTVPRRHAVSVSNASEWHRQPSEPVFLGRGTVHCWSGSRTRTSPRPDLRLCDEETQRGRRDEPQLESARSGQNCEAYDALNDPDPIPSCTLRAPRKKRFTRLSGRTS